MLQSERENATGCLLIDLVVKQWYLENNFHLFQKKKISAKGILNVNNYGDCVDLASVLGCFCVLSLKSSVLFLGRGCYEQYHSVF